MFASVPQTGCDFCREELEAVVCSHVVEVEDHLVGAGIPVSAKFLDRLRNRASEVLGGERLGCRVPSERRRFELGVQIGLVAADHRHQMDRSADLVEIATDVFAVAGQDVRLVNERLDAVAEVGVIALLGDDLQGQLLTCPGDPERRVGLLE